MRCAECESSEKVIGEVPVICRYGGHNYFLSGWRFERDAKPWWCPYRLKVVDGRDMNEHEDCKQDLHRGSE